MGRSNSTIAISALVEFDAYVAAEREAKHLFWHA
jgi:hypothetical protein